MRFLTVSLLIIMNLILEATVFQYTRIMGVKLDAAIILIVAYAIMRGSAYGAFMGLASGLLMDVMYGRPIGANALAYMVTGYLIGQSHENVFKDSFVPAVVFNFIGVIIFQHIYLMVMYFSNNLTLTNFSYVYNLLRMILPQALYNSVVGAIAYRYFFKLDTMRWMDRRIY